MKTLNNYFNGFMAGVCAEYLYRVQYSIYPVIILCVIAIKLTYSSLTED